MKSLKTNFSESYDLFNKGALIGFAWNPVKKIWSAEPEVWENLLEANPNAKNGNTRRLSVAHMNDDMDIMVSPGTTSQIPTQTAQLKRKQRKTSNAEHNPDEMINHSLARAIKEGNSMFEICQLQVYSE
ncbi:hypothetical protein Ddye_021896 [Dipteronia dyeriana]|uniref:Uncharacterized protein n=1 Tax=Dipteronia dyeriana TaxID=168575 RepID=A0AAD9U3A4_9ROSI|nr:hypothetical protein Ddye_021896 [Dipteronia dyeriana]